MKKILLAAALGLVIILMLGLLILIPEWAGKIYGPASPKLGTADKFQYAAILLWHDGLLTNPLDPDGAEVKFNINSGETVAEISGRLQEMGVIPSASAFRDYLVYSGLDTTIQSGMFTLSPAMSPLAIAAEIQDGTPEEVTFSVLAGWRMEEIAASLPTSGLNISPEEFLAAARTPRSDLDYIPPGAPAEGYLFPMQYTFPRGIRAEELVTTLVQNFGLYMTPEVRQALSDRGLSIYEGVILASIVEREAVVEDEMPDIASVFLNRLERGMKLDSDPTAQYALGWNPAQNTWWTNPLSGSDLQVDSPYNTYLYPGLPPGPISNPSLAALRAVAFPSETPYFYFRARCDGSGRHSFAVTFEDHVGNACP